MISPDRMKSVRIAPATVCLLLLRTDRDSRARSWSSPSSWWASGGGSSRRPRSTGRRRRPSGRSRRATGTNSLSTRATGMMYSSLFFSEPLAIRLMIGSSRSAARPWTYAGVTAVSSTTTPAALTLARPAAAPTSSIDAAANLASATTSSKRPSSPLLIEAVSSCGSGGAPVGAGHEDILSDGRRRTARVLVPESLRCGVLNQRDLRCGPSIHELADAESTVANQLDCAVSLHAVLAQLADHGGRRSGRVVRARHMAPVLAPAINRRPRPAAGDQDRFERTRPGCGPNVRRGRPFRW